MSCTRNALYIKHSHHLRDMIVTYYNHQEHTHKYQTNSPVVYTSVLQEGFRQDFVTVSSPPQLHLQNTQHETAIFLHEHLTVAHFVQVQICGRLSGNNCTSLADGSIPSASFRSKPKLQGSRLKSVRQFISTWVA